MPISQTPTGGTPPPLATTLRTAVDKSALSQNQIAHESGVNQASLNMFMNEKRDLRFETASLLADYFGFTFCVSSDNTTPR